MITQFGRLLSIETPHSYDTLLIASVDGVEAVSRPFNYQVKLLADMLTGRHAEVDIEKMIGNEVTIAIHLLDGDYRYIHAICKSMTKAGQDERFAHYNCEFVPWFDLLKMSSNCRFFQNMTVPDIIEKVFQDLDCRHYKLDLRFTYTKRDYCCQYRETDFDFISRLMEEEGIFYYFKHSDDKHTMWLSDSRSGYEELPHVSTARLTRHGGMEEEEDIITGWEESKFLQTSKWKMRDYHFELQRKTLEVERDALTQREGAKHLVMYDFPGGYGRKFNNTSERLGNVQTEGDEKTNRIAMESDEAHVTVITGKSDCRAFTPGYKVKVASDERDLGEFYITSVQTHAVQFPGYISELEPGEIPFENTFTCIPADTRYHPPITTPRPLIPGPQSAWVVDESNSEPSREEIWPDKFGRVRVKFQWDTEAKYACWLRVAQPWAGRGWGHQWLPRTGDEVLVEFCHGDPDQPIVIGSLYNPDNMPPFKLPDNKTQSGIVTRTSTKGTSHEFNMLRFEDKRGSEQVMIRSQRRADVRVLASYYETTHANRHIHVGLANGTESGGNFEITVSGDNDLHVKGARYIGIDKELNQCVKADAVYDHQANHSLMVKTKCTINAQEIVIEAKTKISLTVGGSFITLDSSGVTIGGMMVKINSGGAGAFAANPSFTDAADAALSDNGEPGYLEKQARAGGGGGGRRKRTLSAQHSISQPVTRRPDGDLQVGDHIIIHGDEDFEQKALRDLSRMDTAGSDRIDRIENSGHDVTIQRGPTNQTTYQNDNDGAPLGQPAAGGGTGTGRGTGSTIDYNPDREPPTAADPSVRRPADVALNHEMSHAVHGAEATDDPRPATNPNNPTAEEERTIQEDNDYRRQRGIPPRADHTVL